MDTKDLIRINRCRICSSEKLSSVIDLGKQPIPNGFLSEANLKRKEKKYPLVAVFCNTCSLMQLKYLVASEVMFDNYLYIPSTSKTRLRHFENLASEISAMTNLKKDSLVIDIGSNDGSLLSAFKNLGNKVLGIDPAENLVAIAKLNGVETILGYFDLKLARKIVKTHGKAKAMTATNVIAHIHNIHEALKGVEALLAGDGVFVMQFPYLLDLIEKNLFDTIYHEHLSYFSVKSLLYLSKKSKLEILDIIKSDLDGGSIKVYWKLKNNKKNVVNRERINEILKKEEEYGLDNKEAYEKFAQRVEELKKNTVLELKKLKKKKKSIVGYGAAAKANVLLNYFGISKKIIDYIVDSTPYKQGLYAPGSHIPIYSEDMIYKTNPDYVIIFAWNFSKEIIEKNKKYKDLGGKFIFLEPEFKIY